ncbi:unnamed protein product [Cylindrotheca closterium]|uniref:Uncharacterized protein n=1 Tax=Cylindrotheca closterium TaxID=2856 RepID=A0AAD2FY30_9STRA|nr:unnamed protein product [Cylindrotheca closterium]
MHLIMLYHVAYTAPPASGKKLHQFIKEFSIQERTGSSILIFSFTRDSNTWRLQALPITPSFDSRAWLGNYVALNTPSCQ